ncbi:MAG: type IV pilus biogenesis/stability protein PilW [Gallionellales bacterium RIFCSPLOWO2_12_FULL_59_22]|nr:MAG: type IV pilus biogenesis/stability protein PilW [Gallionellales bacterium RIFCSPLOWO2_02_FULL_59_110]OGT02084.1 MAG: type IV pilus biogenesis/stability protein PilW [Gallionellales bacterium RIFCSPLOWO2_02_58_13]OGT10372.1 MAG: type IV pilus biogenesis/stability protein PilW [Gallionellales bacterium RIFCSPLOWO2_12_FULL_59_22]
MKKLTALLFSLIALAGCGTPPGAGQADQDQSRSRAIAKVHTELAGMYYERAQMGVALGEIDIALQAERNYAPAYNVRGLIHLALREYKEAEGDFQKSLSLDNSNSEAHNNYGWFLCQRGKEKDSIPHFMAALKNPLYATPERAYLNAGVCSKKAGESKDAEEFLQRALQVQPGLPQALLAMAELRFDNGDYIAAKKYFARYSEKSDSLTAEQLWLAVRIERKVGDRNAEASYAMQLRKRFPDARETRMLANGE